MSAFDIFLYVDVFLGGAAVAMAIRYGRAHFRPPKEALKAEPATAASFSLSSAQREALLRQAEKNFEEIISHSAAKLDHNLSMTAEQINELTKKIATEIVSRELEHYHQNLIKLQAQAAEDLGQIRGAVEGHEAELKAQAKAELEAEKQRLIAQIDTKLADAVGSFLTETLGHNADLGSQEQYLMEALETHKDELKKEVVK